MLKLKLLIVFIISVCSLRAGDVHVDTVMQGYYIPFGNNFVSCKVVIMPIGKPSTSVNTTGNKLSDSLLRVISTLEPESKVWYSEITVLIDGSFLKIPAWLTKIGGKNSASAVKIPIYHEPPAQRAETNAPDTLSAKELGSLVLDRHVYKFTITWVSDGAMYRYEVYGNGVYGEAREKIEKLPSGTTVVIADIKRKEDNGAETIAPSQIHTVR